MDAQNGNRVCQVRRAGASRLGAHRKSAIRVGALTVTARFSELGCRTSFEDVVEGEVRDTYWEARRMRRHRKTGSRGKIQGASKRWVAKVKTDSTHPQAGLFTKDASTIARALASRKVSPKGPSSGMRMLTYFINRAGKGLSRTRRAELERAKRLLSRRIADSGSKAARRRSTRH